MLKLNFKKSDSRKQGRLCLCAFTLAEVLITLGVIGVVAAITIPTLVTKQQKAQTLSQLKKVYSTLNNAYIQVVAENGPITGWGLTATNNMTSVQNIYENMFASKFKVARYCGTVGISPPECWADGTNGEVYYSAYFVLNDGTSVAFFDDSWNPTEAGGRSVLRIYVDLNGLKGPNSWGKDKFVFVIESIAPSNGKLVPYGTDEFHPPEEAACWSSTAGGGNYTAGNGQTCAYTIITLNNWQIPNDYPW